MANKRRVKGDGSIVRYGNKWLCRYWAELSDGTRKRMSFYADDKKTAAQELRNRTAKRDNGEKVYIGKHTVKSYYTEVWKAIIDRDLKASTVEVYERIFRLHILPYIGDEPLIELVASDIEKLIGYIGEKVSARQCRVAKNALSPMLDYAVAQGVMSDNPFRKMNKKAMPKYQAQERDIWEKEQREEFLEVVKDSPYYPIYMLLAHYGIRRGEVLGLRVKDVELRNGERDSDGNEDWGVLKIRQQVIVVKNRPAISTPKTQASLRDLPLTKSMHDLLLPYVEGQKSRDGLLFHTSNNTPIAPRNLERDYYKMIKKAGLERIPLHSLRHMACTSLAERGVPVKTIQAILGHTNLNTTLKIYTHCNMQDKRAAMSMMPEIV